MWLWMQRQGLLKHYEEPIGKGYSGAPEGKNNPDKECLVGIGPIPCGIYRIEPAVDGTQKGPVAMPLTPIGSDPTFGRSGFMIHGDSAEHPGGASHGCIILDRDTRNTISASKDRFLVVLSGD